MRKTTMLNDALARRVRELETRGEVLATGRGHLTVHPHFHLAALVDVVTVEGKLPDDLENAVRARRFSAIVIDSPDDLWMSIKPELKGRFFDVVYANYYVSERLDERLPHPVVGWPSVPAWVLLPRKVPLPDTPQDPLRRLSSIEFAVAHWHEIELRRGATFEEAVPSTEELARPLYDETFAGIVDHPDAGEP